jgi:hypothetical protein
LRNAKIERGFISPLQRQRAPMVAYRFDDSRAGDCVVRHLDSYRGILQVDGFLPITALHGQTAAMMP